MGRHSKPKLGWIVLTAVALVASGAPAATVTERARLREGPSKDTALRGWIEQGTVVTLDGERGGWFAVRSADGVTGYIWQDHLAFEPGERPGTAAPTPTPTPVAPVATIASPPTTTIPDVRPAPPPDRPDPIPSELERLRVEIARLTKAQEELADRIGRGGQGGAPATAPLGSDGNAGAAALFLGAGAVIGWVIGRVAQARRDRRSRIRI